MKRENRKRTVIIFLVTLVLILVVFMVSVIKTNMFNAKNHHAVYAGPALFNAEDSQGDVTVRSAARSSTWGKVFDFNNEGLTENNYQAYTYDITFSNNTKDEVERFVFRLTFSEEAFLASGWNGSFEIHQKLNGGEIVSLVPDLREYKKDDHPLETVTVDGETFVRMKPGDYFDYVPSAAMNAMEIPIKPYEGTTPGFILYVANGGSIEESTLEMDYKFHRLLTSEPLFWISVVLLALWLVALTIVGITSAQIRKYNARHERDNEIINESIETFTGFIDAKDPYTNGHSKRVAVYTKRIAKAMGYDGEELDRIYYVALLHDCGKIGVPDQILGKPGKLTPEEFEIIKSHTVRGGEILKSFKSLKNVEDGARYHHERFDGGGYPEGRAGEDIPLIARMICVADSFDAMNTDRVYRKRLSKERIISELEDNKGRQFDPAIAEIMLGFVRSGEVPAGE
ncbi:MAG: HD-GYP domain-containing protein [Lachnospiraceae bacterium]|nr:HD-GYP domain-containing protein [Lachnospiraceae bacterium]